MDKEAGLRGAIGSGLMSAARWLGKPLAKLFGGGAAPEALHTVTMPPTFGNVMAGKATAEAMHAAQQPTNLGRVGHALGGALNNPMAQMGLLIGAGPLIEGGMALFRGEDPRQAQAHAAQQAGMQLAQASTLGDNKAVAALSQHHGLQPAVSQALQMAWGHPQLRSSFANQEQAANFVYQLGQHAQLNPKLTGQQLLQIVLNQGKTASARPWWKTVRQAAAPPGLLSFAGRLLSMRRG
jgi:hypothetical protein